MAPAQVQRWNTFHNGFDQMFRDAVPMPTPGRDEVLVEIHTVSLNYRDTQGSCNVLCVPIRASSTG